ncbi:lipopolysaccharide biosynthesis protein [Micromonospora carbonacea]|uniref:Membrane protein involved in the export of O-antigen and teichoic acid n=1 Tax=Micromonospora carbonacea TaxID=47853 RepID=A0A7H8XIQ1_9ACTN|nr:hypothetical protein [Micromonospora carbonacea]MBB5827578.1 O-antigen/teichoic acid export membrane protein [Micromonospora carbonacea]QLD24675.1 hypothetical protein HXZ27_11085 [Micromonospora carbonacea]
MANPAPGGRWSGLSRVSWFLAGLAMTSLAQWTIVTVLARAGSPGLVGQYALGLAVGAPVVLVCGLGLQPVLVTDVAGRFTFHEYLRLRLAGMAVALLAIGVVAYAMGSGGGPVVLLVGVAKALDAVGEIYFGILQRRRAMRTVGLSMALNAALSVVVTTGLLLATGSVAVAALGSVAGSALGSVGYPRWVVRPDLRRAAGAGGWAALRRQRRLVVTALPVGFAYSLTSFTGNVPMYVVQHELGAQALGVFAALSYATMGANLLYAAMYQVLLHRMAELAGAGRLRALRGLVVRLVLGSLLFGLAGALVARLAGEVVLGLLYGRDYSRHWPVLVVLALGIGASGALYFVNAALLALHRFQHHLTATLPTLGLVAAASLLLVPRHGLIGAASAAVLALVVEAVTKTLLLRHALARAVGGPGTPPPGDGGPRDRPAAGPVPPERSNVPKVTI